MTDRTIRVLAAAAVLLVAGIAAVVSFVHIEHLAVTHGQTLLAAALLPLSIDGTVAAASLAMLRAARAGVPTPAAVALARFAPWWAWLLIALVLFVAFALAGRPQGTTITTRAELPAHVQPPTGDVIIRALGSLGIAEINRAIKDMAFPPLPAPVREDGPGWKAEIDLPYGVTAAMVVDRREQLASGLRRPLGAVWPEPVTHEHAGRLELWVGRADVSKARPPVWPLLRSGQADVFQPQPFGTDVRGRTVKAR